MPPAEDGDAPRADGSAGVNASSGSSRSVGSSVPRAAVRTEQPTVISGRVGSQMVVPITESACRFLQGKIAPGDHLGHFELVEYIGGGGMGRVFRAFDARLARHVAVKILSPDQGADQETRLRFQNEAQSAARLDHENIARVFYVGEDHGLQYIVFEYIEGDNIRDLVDRKGPLSLAEAISFTLQVAEALDHAWQRAVVHRDIKPSNVLITRGSHVKLIDMGLARFRQVDAVADLTASGMTLGTFDYISPEQARDPRAADVRSDIYSLGCTLFFMLAGRPPFPDGTVLQKLLQHQGDAPPELRPLRPDVPEDLSRIVRKMLAKEPRHRYSSPRPLIDDLLAVAHGLGLGLVGKGIPVRTPLRRRGWLGIRRHLPWLVPTAALVAVAAAVQWFGAAERGEPDLPPSNASGVSAIETTDDDPPRPPEDAPPAKAEPAKPTPPKAVATESPSEAKGGKAGRERALPDWLATGVPINFGPGQADSMRPDSRLPGGGESDPASLRTSLDPALLGIVGKRPPRTGVLSVVERPEGDGQFASLAAACAAARDGDVIELCFQGVKEEAPFRLSNLRLTIRAGDGFRPTIRFRPLIIDAEAASLALIAASGGRLTLEQTAIELTLPPQSSAQRWSLFSLRDGQTVRLDRCVLTINQDAEARETQQRGATFFRALPPRSGAAGSDVDAGSPIILELVNSIVRGEGVAVRSEQLQPVRLTWQNGLAAVSQPLLVAEGGQDAPGAADAIEVDLQHVTAYAPGGLCVFDDLCGSSRDSQETSTPGLPAEVRLANCIVIGDGRRPMILHATSAMMEAVSRRFSWHGDHNSYQNVPVLWSVRGDDGQAMFGMTFDEWTDYWGGKSEKASVQTPLAWLHPLDASLSPHAMKPDDFLLGDSPVAQSQGAASDGGKIGLRAELLPAVSE